MEKEIPLAMVVLLLGCPAPVDHAHGPLPLLPASTVEACLSIFCQYRGVLLLEAHAEAVHTDGPSQAPLRGSGCRGCSQRIPESRHNLLSP